MPWGAAIWNKDGAVDRLRQLWAQGASAADIAPALSAEFNIPISRSAVLGKAHRLKLSGRKPDPKKPKVIRPRRLPNYSIRSPRAEVNRKPPIDIRTAAPPNSLRITLDNLQRGQCRYPTGDLPPFLYCGNPVREDSSYCEYCHAITHLPPRGSVDDDGPRSVRHGLSRRQVSFRSEEVA